VKYRLPWPPRLVRPRWFNRRRLQDWSRPQLFESAGVVRLLMLCALAAQPRSAIGSALRRTGWDTGGILSGQGFTATNSNVEPGNSTRITRWGGVVVT
jgi:hypothetical protein